MTREHLYRRARAVFGTDHQIGKAREEAAELVLSICHRERDGDDAIVEECADVEITNAQLRLILGADRVDAMVAVKLARLEERVAKAEDAACPYAVGDFVEISPFALPDQWKRGVVTEIGRCPVSGGLTFLVKRGGDYEPVWASPECMREWRDAFPEVPTKPSKVAQ